MKKWLGILSICCLAVSAVLANSKYDLQELTPAVKASLDARKARFSELKELKKQGVVGENNQGYVEALGGDARVKEVVRAENADRKKIYQAIVEQNELGPDALPTVEEVFAKIQREKAEAGEKVQDPSGKWN